MYELTLHKTYYEKGFFNLGVSVDNYIQPKNGLITIFLGETKQKLEGRLNRDANLNSTPRIYGGSDLVNWFQVNFNLKDSVLIYILSPNKIWIKNTNV